MGKVVLRLTTAQVVEKGEIAEDISAFNVLVKDGPDAIQEASSKIGLMGGEFVSEVKRVCCVDIE